MTPTISQNAVNPRTVLARGLPLCIVMLCALHASGQVMVPSLRLGPRAAVFATATDIKPDFRGFEDYSVGGVTVGGYIQTRNLLGVELRGSIVRLGGREHQESVLLGPRASMHFGHFTPYLAGLGGGAHSWFWRIPGDHQSGVYDQVSGDLSILGGMDFHTGHHLSIRLAEASYAKIYRSDRTLNAVGVSAGLVYHVPWLSPR